jgi:hypothetical protein
VTRALKRRDSPAAEVVCLAIATLLTVVTYSRMLHAETASWAVHLSPRGNEMTAAGWWVVIVSNPLFWFLPFRWLWRLVVWSGLLRGLAALELRLVATHPDGHGGIAFIGEFPNAYAAFIFAISTVLGAAIAHELSAGEIELATYGYLMGCWLLIVYLLFAWPLLAFHEPLADLKKQSLAAYSKQATRHHRAVERELLGWNVAAAEDADPSAAGEIPDSSKAFGMAGKLSAPLVSRSALFPVSVAALLPLLAAGATQLPFKELLKIAKRLLIL